LDFNGLLREDRVPVTKKAFPASGRKYFYMPNALSIFTMVIKSMAGKACIHKL